MNAKKTMIVDFTRGNITKQLVIFAAPLFLSSLMQVVYNMVDMIVVGNVMGEKGLSAVSVGGDVSSFMTFLGMGFANAGQVLISKYIGAGKQEKVGKFVANMFTVLSGLALVLTVVCLLLREPILLAMNTPEKSYQEALNYSTICMIGMVFIYGYNSISAVLRGLGDSKHPFIFITIASVLNVVLDLLFVAVLPLGAGGAALATVISQGVSFLACALFLYRRRSELGFHIHRKDFVQIDKGMMGDLTKLGVPMAIKSASIMFSKLFVNFWINSYGVSVSAFAGIANKIGSISNLFSNAFNTAGSSMVGQNIGAGSYRRVPKIALRIAAITGSIAVALSVFILVFPQTFFMLFTREAGVLVIGMEFVPVAVLLFFGSACRAPANAIINGSGNYRINFATAILDGIIMRVGLSLLFGVALQMGYFGFWLGDALAGFTPMVIGIVFYWSGRWKK